jgi:hypothetical protein
MAAMTTAVRIAFSFIRLSFIFVSINNTKPGRACLSLASRSKIQIVTTITFLTGLSPYHALKNRKYNIFHNPASMQQAKNVPIGNIYNRGNATRLCAKSHLRTPALLRRSPHLIQMERI